MSIAANCCCCLLLKILMNYISQCHDIRANFSLRLWSSFCKMIGKQTIINTTNTSFFFRLAVLLLGMPYRLFKHFNQVFRDLKSSEVWGTTKKPPSKFPPIFVALLRAASTVLHNRKASALTVWIIQKLVVSCLATSSIYPAILWESRVCKREDV